MTQQNAALVEETSATAETLRAEAEQMRGHVGFFKTSPSSENELKGLVDKKHKPD